MSVRSVISPSVDVSRSVGFQPEADAPPTRDRKLKSLTAEQVASARSLILPVAPAKRQGERIVFPPDHTPPEPEDTALPAPIKRGPGRPPGSGSRVAPPKSAITPEAIAAAKTAISPAPSSPPSPEDRDADMPAAGPELNDDEMVQIVRVCHEKYGPILSLDQASDLSKLAKQTLRERVSKGWYAASVVRGRPLRFWTHRFVQEVMR